MTTRLGRLVILLGPKGSGKSHIGRLLERSAGVHFLHVEPLWMQYQAECARVGQPVVIREGVSRVRPHIESALRTHPAVSVETTGASQEILDDLLRLGDMAGRVIVRVHAPWDVCLKRIAQRDQTQQIPTSEAMIRKVYELSLDVACVPDVQIENQELSDAAILARIAPLLPGRGGA